jgi:hypothetical protein
MEKDPERVELSLKAESSSKQRVGEYFERFMPSSFPRTAKLVISPRLPGQYLDPAAGDDFGGACKAKSERGPDVTFSNRPSLLAPKRMDPVGS